jgi:presenilin-like A22 family membrane protease
MDHRRRVALACAGIVGIFLLVQLGTLALIEPFQQEGHQVVDDTSDPTISVIYLVAILVVTALMLTAIKYGGESFLRVAIIFASAYISLFVFEVLLPDPLTVSVDAVPVNVIALAGALVLGAALYFHPEWYVINTAGVIMGVGAAGLFGINFGILPAIVLLVALAIYDAISVYGTEHMLTLASGAMNMRVPVVLVVPVTLSYSFLEEGTPDHLEDSAESAEKRPESPETVRDGDGNPGDATGSSTPNGGQNEPGRTDDTGEQSETDHPDLDAETLAELGPEGIAELDDSALTDLDPAVLDEVDDDVAKALRERLPDREAIFIGLGDAVIPTVLVASAAFFVDAGPEFSFGVATASLPAVTAIAGTLLGLVVLLWMVLKGRAHAGLPLLNGGSIAGYLVGTLASGLSLVEALGIEGFL